MGRGVGASEFGSRVSDLVIFMYLEGVKWEHHGWFAFQR